MYTVASSPGPLLERILRATFDPRDIGHVSTSRVGESLGTRLCTQSSAHITILQLVVVYVNEEVFTVRTSETVQLRNSTGQSIFGDARTNVSYLRRVQLRLTIESA